MIGKKGFVSHLSQLGLIAGLALSMVLTIATSSFADYAPHGGEPPTGGSTTSGMWL